MYTDYYATHKIHALEKQNTIHEPHKHTHTNTQTHALRDKMQTQNATRVIDIMNITVVNVIAIRK